MTFAQLAKKTFRAIDNNSPLILTGLAVAGFVSTAVLTAKATWNAASIISHEVLERDDILTNKEIVKLTWEQYVPAVGMGLVSITCVVGAQSINNKRQAALISGFTIAESAFREYREKVVERFSEKQEQKVRDDIAKDHIEANPVSKQVIISGSGDVLCFDSLSGRYFNCDMETLRRAQNDINAQCINEMYASQNDFYRLIGLPPNGYGEEFGWSTDVMLDLQFSAVLTDDGRPCISINYRMSPIRGYYKMG